MKKPIENVNSGNYAEYDKSRDADKQKAFIEGYRKLCEETKCYLVFEDDYWLEHAGEDLDLDEATDSFAENLNGEVIQLNR